MGRKCLGEFFRNELRSFVGNELRTFVRNELRSFVRNELRSCGRNELRSYVWNELRSLVRNELRHLSGMNSDDRGMISLWFLYDRVLVEFYIWFLVSCLHLAQRCCWQMSQEDSISDFHRPKCWNDESEAHCIARRQAERGALEAASEPLPRMLLICNLLLQLCSSQTPRAPTSMKTATIVSVLQIRRLKFGDPGSLAFQSWILSFWQ